MSDIPGTRPWYPTHSGYASMSLAKASPMPEAMPPGADVVTRAQGFLDRVGRVLREKNAAYGDSAANPVRIFSKSSADEAILVRIDDKLSRIARGDKFLETEDVILDLVGYLALLVAVREGK